jgi:hypothetical protein
MHSFFENVANYTFPFATVGGKNFAKLHANFINVPFSRPRNVTPRNFLADRMFRWLVFLVPSAGSARNQRKLCRLFLLVERGEL